MKTSMLSVLVLFSGFVASVSFAGLNSKPMAYYGAEFYQELSQGASDEALVSRLQTILRGAHKVVPGGYDQIGGNCSGDGCYQHISLGYDRARIFLMGVYYLGQNNGEYAVWDVYCSKFRNASEFGSYPPAPNTIPDGNIVNTEHTWPQSKFSGRFDKGMQKSDLHHLFPTDNEMNGVRGNIEFGEVAKDKKKLKCPVARYGAPVGSNSEVFEPPQEHKGNVARALFYFSVHYGMPITPRQEAFLRKWNQEDPVDEEEMKRNNEIFKAQGNRNPFVDYPELADRISDFKLVH